MSTESEELVETGFREAIYRYIRGRPAGEAYCEYFKYVNFPLTDPPPQEPTVLRIRDRKILKDSDALAHSKDDGTLCMTQRLRGLCYPCKCGKVIYDDRS